MIAKLVVEGNEFDIEILDPKLQELITPKKKTGYEKTDGKWYYVSMADGVNMVSTSCMDGEFCHEIANYYSDETVAENNVRADRLMRQLRRFAVEHRQNEIDWSNSKYKYTIRYGHNSENFIQTWEVNGQNFGCIWFDSPDAVKLAIETFKDELIWYFTEYKDSL